MSSAVLTPQEVTELLKTIKDLKRAGKSIILITHKLSEVMRSPTASWSCASAI